MKPYLATAAGGYVLTNEIAAVEPRLCRDNLWRPVAVLKGGGAFELDFQSHEHEGAVLACETIITELWQSIVWGDRYGYSSKG